VAVIRYNDADIVSQVLREKTYIEFYLTYGCSTSLSLFTQPFLKYLCYCEHIWCTYSIRLLFDS